MQIKTGIFIQLALLCLAATQYDVSKPAHFPEPHYNIPSDNNGIQLGRALFYDPILSKDGTISCASCHSPYNAFAHTDHRVSHGIDDSIGTRNAPALFNLAWQQKLMWDGAIHHIDVQPLAPLTHSGEMGETVASVLSKLQNNSLYRRLFKNAFGDTTISSQRILKALSAFQLSLVSADAKYDHVIQGKDSFSEQEKSGYSIFKKNCNSCHSEPLFSNYEFRNNGLPIDTNFYDYGRMKVTLNKNDSLFFKVPTLRNLSYTYPYMHDGRFDKLRQVIKHYTIGIKDTERLSNELSGGIEMSKKEQTDLISFLLTLNDKQFILNKDNKYPLEILNPN